MRDLNPGDYIVFFENEIHQAREFHTRNDQHEVYLSFMLLKDGLEVVLELMGGHLDMPDQDYSDLDTSWYILRSEVCLEFARRLLVTDGDAKHWLLDMLNHVNAFVHKYEEKELETSDLPKMQG
jgi:hypothetical protein